MEELNKPMAILHKETPHERMEGLTKTVQSIVNKSKIQKVKSAKLFDCSECGNVFSSYSEQNSHNDEYHAETRHRTTEALDSKYQEDDIFEDLTMEEREELETLHQEEMEPTQEEEDWMLLTAIKEERNDLAKKYLPIMSNYEVKDICDICERYFLQKGKS